MGVTEMTPTEMQARILEMGAAIDRLRKECATCCLQLLTRATFVDDNAALADLEQGKTDPGVLALVRDYQDFPLDTCARCGRPAPCKEELVDGPDAQGNVSFGPVCAWGCPEGGPG
jgi:hypothetical protein